MYSLLIQFVLVTILAFFYVPFNTVTSIYSMNIQEINGLGHPIWQFWVTAICVLLLSVMSWVLTLQVQKIKYYRKWRKSSRRMRSLKPPKCKHGLGIHVLLIVYLFKNSTAPATWILKSGVLVNALSSKNVGPRFNHTGYDQCDNISACNFIEFMTRDPTTSKQTTTGDWHITWRPGYAPWRSGN